MEILTPESRELRKALADLDQSLFTAKTIRSLVIDFYSANKLFVKEFQRLTSPDSESISSENWAKLFEAKNDWRFCEAATEFLRESGNSTVKGYELLTKQIILIIGEYGGHNTNVLKRVFDTDKSSNKIDISRQVEESTKTEEIKRNPSLSLEQQARVVEAFKVKDPAPQDQYVYSTRWNVDDIKPNIQPLGNDSESRKIAGGVLAFFALALIFAIAAGLEQSKTISNSESTKVSFADEVNDTTAKADDAVLICENKQSIDEMQSLRNTIKSESPYEISLLQEIDNKIAKAQYRIRFLQQDGKWKYTENDCLYGSQWYTQNADSGAPRMFFAISRKCQQPVGVFDYWRNDADYSSNKPAVTSREAEIRLQADRTATLVVPNPGISGYTVSLNRIKCG